MAGPKPRSRARRIAVGVARWTLRIVALVLVLVVVLVLVLLYSGGAFAWVAGLALDRYNARIPGTIEVAAIDGRLVDDLRLRGVVARDREGRALVAVDRLDLEWSAWALVGGALEVDALTIAGVRVNLSEGSGFADLAIPGPPAPEEPSETFGPSMPLDLGVGALHLEDVAIVGAGGEAIADGVALEARDVAWSGTDAALRIVGGAATIPGVIEVTAIELDAAWSAPTLAVAATIDSDLGRVELASEGFDLEAITGALTLAADLHEEAVIARAGPGLGERLAALGGDPSLRLWVEAEAGDAAIGLVAAAPGLAELALAAAGPIEGPPEYSVGGHARVNAPALLGPEAAALGEIEPAFLALSEGTSWEDLRARLGLRVAALGGLGLRAELARTGAEDGELEVALAGAGIDLEAAAAIDAGALARARWRLAIPELATPAAIAGRFAAVPALEGELRTQGTCAGEAPSCSGTLTIRDFEGAGVTVAELKADLEGQPIADAPVARVDLAARDLRAADLAFADVDLQAAIGPSMTEETGPMIASVDLAASSKRGRAGDRIALSATARLGEPLEVEAKTLELHLRDLDAHLERPARVRVAGERITVDGLDLDVAGGHVVADGALDRAGESDLVVAVDGLRLRPLSRLVPGLRAGGVVDLNARLRGPATAPIVDAQLRGDALALRGAKIGDVAVAIDVADGRARARVDLRGPLAEQVQVRASAPLGLDLAAGSVSVPRDRIDVDAAIDRLDLARLRDFAPAAPALKGVVDLKASLHGPTTRPRAELELRAAGLEVDAQEIGAITVQGRWASDGDAEATITAARRGASLRVEGRALPVRLDLSGAGPRLNRGGDVDLEITAEGVDLRRQLAGVVDDDLGIAGDVGLKAWIHGPLRAPEVSLGLAGVGLRVRGQAIGDLDLRLAHRDDRAEVDLGLEGALARAITLHAAAPVRIRPLAGDFTWLKGQDHAVDLDVERFDLACLAGLGVAPGLVGVVDLEAHVDGSAAAPTLAAAGQARRLAWQGEKIGGVDLEVGYRDRQASLDLAAGLGRQTTVSARVRAPVELDLTRGQAGWIDGERGEVDLAIDHLDADALALAGPLPKSLIVDLGVRLGVRGGPGAFTAGLAVDGKFGHKEVGALPLELRARADERAQEVDLALGRDLGSLVAHAAAKADVFALAEGRGDAGATPFEATLAAREVDLRPFEALLPEALFDLEGTLKADLEARGPLAKPEVDGVLALQRGGVTLLPLQQRLSAIDVELRADGQRFTLKRLAAASGPGRIRGEGVVELAGGKIVADAEVALRDFPLVRPGLPQMQVATRVKARVRSDDAATEIKVDVSDTDVSITGVNNPAPAPIPESDAVTYHDDKARVSVAADVSPPPNQVAADTALVRPEAEPEAPPRRFTLTIALTEPVDIEGPATAMRWDGKVTAVTFGEDREVRGQLRAQGGHLDLLGNRFAIESGTVTLPEDEDEIDPFLSLVARAPTSAGLVTATFRGRLSRPELIFSSEPPMSQSAILTLLVTGSADAAQADEGKVLAKAASLLASFKNPALSQYLDRKLGIDRVGLGFGEGLNQPILTVGKRVTSDLYVETALRINAPRQQNRVEVRVEYEFVPHWTLETFFGDAAVGGLDVFWRRVFGKPRPPQRRNDDDDDDDDDDDASATAKAPAPADAGGDDDGEQRRSAPGRRRGGP